MKSLKFITIIRLIRNSDQIRQIEKGRPPLFKLEDSSHSPSQPLVGIMDGADSIVEEDHHLLLKDTVKDSRCCCLSVGLYNVVIVGGKKRFFA